MINNEGIYVVVSADSSGVNVGMQEAVSSIKSSIASMNTEFSGMGSMFEGIKSQFMGIGAAFAGAFAIKHIIDVASDFEQLEIRLKAVMGTAADGKEAFAWIKQFAVDTPYSVRQVTDAFMTLKNFGLDPMDGTLQKVSDASAKYGNSAETQGRVALALGQAWARGKLQGQDILQMIDAGIPVWDLLEKSTGKNAAELQKMSEKGQITREMMVGLIDKMGEVSAGASADKMNSFAGAVSNMGDAFENAIDNVRNQGGFNFITEGIRGLTELIPPVVAMFAEGFGAIGDVIGALWSIVSDVFSSIRDIIHAVFGSGGSALTSMEFFKNACAVVTITIADLRATFEIAFTFIKVFLAEVVAFIVMDFNIIDRAMHLDFAGVKAAWKDGMANVVAIATQGANDVVNTIANLREKIDGTLFGKEAIKVADHTPVKPTGMGGGDTGKHKKDPSQMADFKAELEKKIELEVGYFKESTSLELSFWQEKLNIKKLSQKDQLAIEHNIYELKKKLAKEAFSDEINDLKYQSESIRMDGAERVKIAQQIAQRTADAYGQGSREHIKAIHDVEAAKRAAQESNNEIARQEIETARVANQAMLDIDIQRIEQMKAMGVINAADEITAKMAVEERKYQIEREAQSKRAGLMLLNSNEQKAAYAKMAQDAIAHETQMSALRNKRWLEEHATTLKIVNDFKSSMAASFKGLLTGTMTISGAIKNLFKGVFDSIASSLAEFAANWIATQIMMKLFGQKTSNGEIASAAGLAGANAVASMAGAPFPISVGAPAFGLAMSAAAMAYQGLAGSAGFAVGSWNVPEDGIAKIHKGETIMPEKFAEKYRNGESGGGAPIVINTKGGDFVHMKDMAKLLKTMNRNFVTLKS